MERDRQTDRQIGRQTDKGRERKGGLGERDVGDLDVKRNMLDRERKREGGGGGREEGNVGRGELIPQEI